jgi:putative PLP-dependent aminotransferase (TIGR04422 family)
MNYLPLWPSPQKFKYSNKIQRFPTKKLNMIENFFAKKYNSKYCVLTSSARVGILLILKFKKYNRSKLVKIPKWSSHCLYNSIGSLTNISSDFKSKDDCSLLVHHLGNTFKNNNKLNLGIDDSSDSIPGENFLPYYNSKFSEVVSLPKIIGSYCGGIVLTNNIKLYQFIKTKQKSFIKLARIQSYKKYNCLIMMKKNFEWHYHESVNFSIDENTIENIYDNLENFELNKKIILERKKLYFNNRFLDKFRIGSCQIINYNKKLTDVLETRMFNKTKLSDNEKFFKINVLPLHFTINQKDLEIKINEISKIRI